MDKNEIMQLSTASLAYLGDSVLELMVRRRLVLDGRGGIHTRSLQFVTAVAQSNALRHIESMLDEDEASVYRRGRNNTHTAPKSATHAQYSRATGFECLFAYLYLAGESERLEELFNTAYGL